MMITEASGVPASTQTQETYYTITEVSAMLRLANSSVRRLMKTGKLRHLKIDKAVRIPASAITEHMQGGLQ